MLFRSFLRDDLTTRGPDVLPLYAVLTAALAAHVPDHTTAHGRAVALVLAVLVTAVALASAPWSRVGSPRTVLSRVGHVTERLRTAAPDIQPNPRLAPLVSYLARCTPDTSRILVGGFAPEVPVLAGRLFASGVPYWLPGYYEDRASVARDRKSTRLNSSHT